MKLSIGTAQFGLNYGITNKEGMIDLKEIHSILKEAKLSGIDLIDTAHAYGCAQKRLGEMSEHIKDFKITTKIGVGIDVHEMSTKQIQELLSMQLESSLRDLRANKVDTLLLHTSKCLSKSHKNGVLEFLNELKEQGTVKSVGISIYSQSELDEACMPSLDVVQLPLSLYNQNMIRDGSVEHLRRQGIHIQARGVFHQGLLLCSAELWPDWISEVWKQKQLLIERYVEKTGSTLVSVAIGYIRSIIDIDTVVVGVCSRKELKSIVDAWNKQIEIPKSFIRYSGEIDDVFCDPRKWPIR